MCGQLGATVHVLVPLARAFGPPTHSYHQTFVQRATCASAEGFPHTHIHTQRTCMHKPHTRIPPAKGKGVSALPHPKQKMPAKSRAALRGHLAVYMRSGPLFFRKWGFWVRARSGFRPAPAGASGFNLSSARVRVNSGARERRQEAPASWIRRRVRDGAWQRGYLYAPPPGACGPSSHGARLAPPSSVEGDSLEHVLPVRDGVVSSEKQVLALLEQAPESCRVAVRILRHRHSHFSILGLIGLR